MGDDITIGVTEIVNNIEVTAQPNDQIVDISVIDNADDVTLNITPTVIEINVNRGSSYAKWGTILGTLSDQTDLQNALDLKANLVGGKVPASELPSYVDDVVEVANYAALPTTGEAGKIYVTLDNNKIYRWSGSVYIEIAANNAIWGAITGTLSSQTDLQSALDAKANISGQVFTGAISATNLSGTNTGDQTLSGLGGVPDSRTLTINGTTYDLTANRSWTITAGVWGQITGTLSNQTDLQAALDAKVQSVAANAPLGSSGGTSPTISITQATTSSDGYLSSTDWNTFNNKQPLDADLTAIAGLSGNAGLLRKTAANTWVLDLNVYATTSQLHDAVTIGTANGLSLSNQVLSLALASTSTNGSLSSTDWNTFNNKVPTSRTLTINGTSYDLSADRSWTISAGISGSGTTGKIPLFTGSTALGDSSLTEFSTYLNLTKPLTIAYSTATSASGLNLSLNNSGSTGTTLYVFNAGTGNLAQFQKSNNTTAFLINSSGNVGIGTTSPAEKLHVMGNSIFNNSSNNGTTLRFVSNSNSLYGDAFILSPFSNCIFSSNITYNSASGYVYDKNGYGASVRLSGGSTNNGDIFFNTFTSGTAGATATELNRMTILNGGNVGIGTASPSALLHLATSSGNGSAMRFESTSTNGRTYGIGSNFATGNGEFAIYDYTANAERMRITSGGNVGIGTTSPAAKLDVHSVIRATNTSSASFQNAALELFTYNGSSVSAGTSLFSTNSNFNYGTIISNQTNLYGIRDGGIRIATGIAPIVFSNGNADIDFATERMRITSGGQVQISSPISDALKLTNTNSGAYNGIIVQNDASNQVVLGMGGSTVGGTNQNRGYSGTVSNIDYYLMTNNSPRLLITSGGNVGIGTTSPSYQLQLSTDSAAKPTSALWTIASDERIKENINSYTKGLNELLKINPITYDYNGLGGFKKGKGGVGIIAQEIAEILPDSVSSIKGKLNETDEEEIDILNFNGHELTYILINAVKELKAEIEILKNK